jgi:hypothetical protein
MNQSVIQIYPRANTFPPKIRLSHSTLQLLHTCERLFQLEKLLNTGQGRDEAPHLVGGQAFGAGVASYFIHGDADKAIYEAWLAYWPQLEDEKRNQSKYLNALYAAFFEIDNLRQEYEVVYFNGKPAAELSFRLNIDDTFYFVGYIDVVLRNIYTGKYLVLECKHTGLELHDIDPLYKNSGQALGYSIILDEIVGEDQSEYGVLYFVAQLGKGYSPKIRVLPYDKNLLDRLNWFMTLGLDVEHLHRMEGLKTYPKRGDACLNYMRPCKYFVICDLHSFESERPYEEDTKKYDFTYDLQDVISKHLDRI